MVLGYTAPGRDITHRAKPWRIGQIQISDTYCGLVIDGTTWTQHEVDEPCCTRCAKAYAKRCAALRPFAPGEARRYSPTRHPGLAYFHRVYGDEDNEVLVGFCWRVADTGSHWSLTRDARAPRGRPWQLTLGIISDYRVAYFATVHETVEWTLRLVDADRLVALYRALKAGTWDATVPDPPLPTPDSGTLKETNPA